MSDNDNTVHVSNCPHCNHFPTQLIATPQGTKYRSLEASPTLSFADYSEALTEASVIKVMDRKARGVVCGEGDNRINTGVSKRKTTSIKDLLRSFGKRRT